MDEHERTVYDPIMREAVAAGPSNDRSVEKEVEPTTQRLTLDTVDDAFRYQPWDEFQRDHGEQVRDALVAAAKVILRTVPDTPLRTQALNDLITARMRCNAAISFRGRF